MDSTLLNFSAVCEEKFVLYIIKKSVSYLHFECIYVIILIISCSMSFYVLWTCSKESPFIENVYWTDKNNFFFFLPFSPLLEECLSLVSSWNYFFMTFLGLVTMKACTVNIFSGRKLIILFNVTENEYAL